MDESKKALVPLQEERKKLEDKIIDKEKELNKLKSDVKEFRRGNVVIKRGQTLFIAQLNSNPNVKSDLAKVQEPFYFHLKFFEGKEYQQKVFV